MGSWALVTGATSGIGESFTRLLAENNYNIVLVARDLPRLQERARGLQEKFNVETHIIQADLATDAGCSAVEQNAEQQMFDVLIRTPMRLMHTALPGMKERNKGIIINVSSVAGFIAGGTYSASKSYLTVLSESLHTELAGTNIRISALCPGFTRTEFHQRGRMSMKGLPNFMWLDSDKLVARSWSDALKGKAVSIPGWQYQLLVFVIHSLPRAIIRKVGMNLRAKQRK